LRTGSRVVPSQKLSSLPTVSVIVPCYNFESYLRECVKSVLGQGGVELRVTIIDDASTDDSAQVAAQLAAEDRRVGFVAHRVNVGTVRTYNEGLARVTGTYTVLIDGDD